jgi:hypothetical protein
MRPKKHETTRSNDPFRARLDHWVLISRGRDQRAAPPIDFIAVAPAKIAGKSKHQTSPISQAAPEDRWRRSRQIGGGSALS